MEHGNGIICKLDHNKLHIPKKILNLFLEGLGKWNIALLDDSLVIARIEFFGNAEWRKMALKEISQPLSVEINGRATMSIPTRLIERSALEIGEEVVLVPMPDHFRLVPFIVAI